MKTAELGDYFLWKDQVVKVEWINTGQKAIGFVVKEWMVCPHCKQTHSVNASYEVIEGSPMFQDNAQPLKTIVTN